MLSSTLSRFHIALIMAVLLGALIGWRCGLPCVAAVVALLLLLIGLGVAVPRLRLFGPYICRGQTERRHVALTFDDGPDERSLPALLDLLAKEKVPATFFCVGKKVKANPELAARIVREGHTLGNHSYSHHPMTNLFTVPRLREEVARTQSAIQEATGVAPQWFRPPMGLSNPRIFRVARSIGLDVIGWSARGYDTAQIEPGRVVSRIVRGLKPGAIILLHDGNIPPDRLVATVETLFDRLRELDYEVVGLEDLLR